MSLYDESLTGDLAGLRAVIFDWAGTVIDHGSLAPMGAFVEAFRRFGVEITVAEARAPMGLPKRDHVAAILAQTRVAEAWRAVVGSTPDAAAVDRVYTVFVPMNVAVVADYATLITGAADLAVWLRARGLAIGSTTGYTREIMDRLVPAAAEQGFTVDSLACTGDLAVGRPAPFGLWQVLSEIRVWPAATVVKVDDTAPGIAEGLNAGCWTVGVALTGNLVGLSRDDLLALPDAEVAKLRALATAALHAAGAHLVIDSIAELPGAMAAIAGRMTRGERP